MSRRQSRVSVDGRQNDALLEFETFKKKFLLANKHITKLNSTLSVRIEELNAQISILQVENLRLRASEIALTSQLKKEREKSRKILADAETATHTLMKQLGHIRKSYHVPHSSASPEPAPIQAPPRARRPTIDPNASPPANRIARPPGIPGIFEEEEEDAIDEDDYIPSPSPPRRKSKARPSSSSSISGAAPSSSRLPLPSHAANPSTEDLIDFDEQLSKAGKKKPTRRQSGLLSTTMAITTVTPSGYTTELIAPRPPSPAFGSPLRRSAGLQEAEDEAMAAMGVVRRDDEDEEEDPIALSVTRREKMKKRREKEEGSERDTAEEGKRERERERRRLKDTDGAPGPSAYEGKKPKLKDVTNSPPPRPSLATIDTTHERERQRQQTPFGDTHYSSASSSTARTFLATPLSRPSSSSSSHLPTPRNSSPPLPETDPSSEPSAAGRERRVRKSINYAEPKLNTKMRKPDPPPPPPGTIKRSSSDGAPRRSLESQAAASDGAAAQPPPVAGVKRKKSRAHVPTDDGEESDGTQADAEYASSVRAASATGWVSTEGRRRSVHTSSHARRAEGDEGRRHSMAV